MLKRKSKRVLSIVLAVAMIVGLFPIAAFANEGTSAPKTIYVDVSATETDGANNTYTTLSAAVSAANDGDTIQLNSNVSLSASVDVDDTVTLDLNGKKIDAGTNQISLASGSELIIKDSSNGTGEISASGQAEEGRRLFSVDNATLTLNGGKFNAADNNYGVYASNGGKVIVNAGTFTAGYAPLAGNNTTGDMNFEVNGGTLNAKYGPAIYMPGQVNLTITNGTLNGGISLRMGQVNISGGTINATTTNIDPVKDYYYYSGNAWLADALYVFNGTYASENEEYDNSLDLNITGGTFNCTNNQGSAIAIYDLGKVAQSSDVSISGSAALHSNAEGRSVYQVLSLKDIGVDSPAEGFNNSEYVGKVQSSITGGTFSSDVSKYVPTGYESAKIEEGKYVVQTASNLEAEATVSGDSANATVGGNFSGHENATEDNVATENGTLTIDAAVDNSDVTTSNVTITPEALTSVNEADFVQNVAIKTDVATVTVDSAAWNAMTTNAGTERVTLSVEKKTVAGSAPLTYTLTATNASGDNVYSASNAAGAITISVPYPNGSNPKVFYVGSKGLEDMNASLTDGILSWIARHFSDYVVLDDSVIATITTSNGNVSSYTVADAFATAVQNAADGSVVELMKNITLDATGKANTQGILTITKDITINGNGKTITAANVKDTPSMINVQSGANVTINDLIINGGTNATFTAGTKHGININQAGTVTLNDVTIQNNRWYAVMNNGSDLVLNGLTTSGNQWGINVDNKGGDANLIVNNAGIAEESSIVFDKGGTGKITATINGGSFRDVVMGKDANEKPIATIDSLRINGGTFKTAGIANAIDVEDYLAPGLVYNPYTGQVYKEPEYTGKYSYEIFTKVGDNGAIDVDRYATEGDDVTITVSPDEAYLLDELTVTTGGKEVEVKDNGDGTYTFKMPSADAKIVVTFAEDPDWEPEPEEPAMPFTDVNEGDWFYDVVLYAYDNGLMTGVSATEFAPNQTTTRGMIVSMLARLEGVTSAEDAGFADVAANDWYATAVNWAASVGVVNGYEDDTFRPNAPITREQMAAILYNYADYKGYDVSARADLSDYADAASISSWAEDVLAWANAEGLINGMTATTIDPQGATTRAQTAAMFERFLTAHEA